MKIYSVNTKTKQSLIIGSFFLLMTTLIACNKDSITENTENEVGLYFPDNHNTFYDNEIKFAWPDDLSSYKVSIYTWLNYQSDVLVLDTNLTENILYCTLPANEYIAFVSSNTNDTLARGRFSISQLTDLTNYHPSIPLPLTNYFTQSQFFNLHLNVQYFVNSYEIIIKEGVDFYNSQNTLFIDTFHVVDNSYSAHMDTSLYTESVTIPQGIFALETQYSIGVKAINNYSSSNYSTRTISIDDTDPVPSTLNSPINTVPSGTVTFEWEIMPDIGPIQSPVTYILLLSPYPNFTPSHSGYGVGSLDTWDLDLEPGTYYWRIWSRDAAGNDSYSLTNQLIIS